MFCLIPSTSYLYLYNINSELLAIILIPQSVNERLLSFLNFIAKAYFYYSFSPFSSHSFFNPSKRGCKINNSFSFFQIFFNLFLKYFFSLLASLNFLYQKTGRKDNPFLFICNMFLTILTLLFQID